MTQTSKIAGTLIIAWVVFITVRGELPAYLSMLGMGTCSGSNCCGLGGPTGTGGGSGGSSSCDPLKPSTWADCVMVNPTKA